MRATMYARVVGHGVTFRIQDNLIFTWKGVSEKCAGSPPYQLRVNGEPVYVRRNFPNGVHALNVPTQREILTFSKTTILGNHKINKGRHNHVMGTNRVFMWNKLRPGLTLRTTTSVVSGKASE